ncbi:MAG: hypothetical protein BWK80_54270 [Desulfobacteraceae bacterium IS3]|nr:MAG: hypothetical protein BWK80_54270 [Desulfobacteraceae bacterium IS3]
MQGNIGFIKQLAQMADKGIKKTIKSLKKQIAEHEQSLSDPAQEMAKKHHEHEMRVFKEQLKLAEEEAAKRGILGAGLPCFSENITEEEAEDRTSSPFDWIDPFWSPDYAY